MVSPGGWTATLRGGPHDGKTTDLFYVPIPTLCVPEGRYRRVGVNTEAKTAEYEWEIPSIEDIPTFEAAA